MNHVSSRAKYLSLLVILTFTVGQFQYAYSSYFCTMKHVTLSLEDVIGTASGNSCASSCDGTLELPSEQGRQILGMNCMQYRLTEKKVVDTFTGQDKPQLHIVGVMAVLPAMQIVSQSAGVVITAVGSSSPPPDIPTINSNLRI